MVNQLYVRKRNEHLMILTAGWIMLCGNKACRWMIYISKARSPYPLLL